MDSYNTKLEVMDPWLNTELLPIQVVVAQR